MKHVITWCLCICASVVLAQPVIYKDVTTIVTGIWGASSNGGTFSLDEVTGQTPHEGTKHYKFDYSFNGNWAGVGLNFDNWGSGAAKNFSGYTHIQIAYRGLSGNQSFSLRLRNGTSFSNDVTVGTVNTAYQVVQVPIAALTAGTSFSVAAVRELNLSVNSSSANGTGTVFFDAIELVNVTPPAPPPPSSAANLARAATLTKGINTSNWLEAYWMIPFNAYPEVNRYNRTNISALRNAGFESFRLPITFEHLAQTTPPYTLDMNHVAFDLIDSMLLWSTQMNFKVIIDCHHPVQSLALTNTNYISQIPRLQAIWKQVALTYGHLDPSRVFFEVYNEPTNTISSTNFRVVADSLVATIRRNETVKHSVLVGGAGWNSWSDLISMPPMNDTDIIYTFHTYEPYGFTHQGLSWTTPAYLPATTFPQAGDIASINNIMSAVSAWAAQYGVPINMGEFGASTAADAVSRCNWVQTVMAAANANGIPTFYWDAISPVDAFGIYSSMPVSEANCIPCFKTAMGLYQVLPIELEAWDVVCESQFPTFFWKAYTDAPNHAFQIEESSDLKNWTPITIVDAQVGTSTYEYKSDKQTLAYVRMALMDPNAQVSYAPVKKMACANDVSIKVWPNPASQAVWLQTAEEDIESVALFNALGQIVQSVRVEGLGTTQVKLAFEDLPTGFYQVRIKTLYAEQWERIQIER